MANLDRPTILFVDDEPNVTTGLLARLHRQADCWRMVVCNDAVEALEYAAQHELDTIVTDFRMPGLDGLALIRRLRAMPHHVLTPIVVLTGHQEHDLKRRALDAGADDLLSKPVQTEDLLARLRSALRLKEHHNLQRQYSRELEAQVSSRTRQLAWSRLDVLWRLGRAAEFRDEDTGEHIVRVGLYCKALAEGLGLPDEDVERIFLASPLHDVGKIGVPDSILLAPRKLTDEEWAIMKSHTTIGHAILTEPSAGLAAYSAWRGLPSELDDNPVLACAASIALTHHEWFDGRGYPRGLAGDDIPIEGRIVALADVYDALSSERPYKPAFPEAKVLGILRDEAETHFDPDVYAVFERNLDTFRAIRAEFADRPARERELVTA